MEILKHLNIDNKLHDIESMEIDWDESNKANRVLQPVILEVIEQW